MGIEYDISGVRPMSLLKSKKDEKVKEIKLKVKLIYTELSYCKNG